MNHLPPTSDPDSVSVPRPGHPGIEQRLLRAWKRLDAPPDAALVLAFSGGPDSLALAVALNRIAPLGGFRLTLVHVDHRLRPASAAEAVTASELAAAIGIECHVLTLARDPREAHPGVGVEEAARRERYLVVSQHAADLRAAYVVTAHHQDDQAETVMLHLLRGAGLGGASGMSLISVLTVPWWPGSVVPRHSVNVWRPWLAESRQEIAAYRDTVAPALRPINDPSNADDAMLRNRLRHRLMPLLDDLRPGASGAVARFGSLAASDDQLLTELALGAASGLDRSPEGLSVSELSSLPLPLLRRVLRHELLAQGAASELSAERVDALVAAVNRGHGNVSIEFAGGLRATVSHRRLKVQSDGEPD